MSTIDKSKIDDSTSINELLVLNGLISTTKATVNWAISLTILEDFHGGKLRKSRFFMKQYLKDLCKRMDIEFQEAMYRRFQLAYKEFIIILEAVEHLCGISEDVEPDMYPKISLLPSFWILEKDLDPWH
jgi:hypothetical protein